MQKASRTMQGSTARKAVKHPGRQVADLRRLAIRLVDMLPLGGDVLEVLPGNGALAMELAKAGRFRVAGIDPSAAAIDKACRSAEKLGLRVAFQQGNPASMPFPDSSFDLLVCRSSLKRLADPVATLREMRRVLKPGRRGVIINPRRDVAFQQTMKYIDQLKPSLLGPVGKVVRFRLFDRRQAYTLRQIEALFAQIPFSSTRIDGTPLGVEVWFQR